MQAAIDESIARFYTGSSSQSIHAAIADACKILIATEAFGYIVPHNWRAGARIARQRRLITTMGSCVLEALEALRLGVGRTTTFLNVGYRRGSASATGPTDDALTTLTWIDGPNRTGAAIGTSVARAPLSEPAGARHRRWRRSTCSPAAA